MSLGKDKQMKKIGKKTIMKIVYGIWLLTVCMFLYFYPDCDLMILAWIANISYIILILNIYLVKKDFFDFSIIFMTFIFLFCNGQIFLYSLGINMEKRLVFVDNTQREIIRATNYFILSFLFMGLGILIVNKNKPDTNEKVSDEFNNAIKYVAFLFLIVSIVPYLYNLFKALIITRSGGYGNIYKNESSSTSIGIGYITRFFIPSLLLLLYSYKDNKIKRNIIMIICLIIAGLGLIIGGRGEPISIIVIIILYYYKYIKKFKGKQLFKLFIIAMLVVTIIPIVAKTRSGTYSLRETVDLIFEGNNSPIIETISELGGTMNAWCLTDKVVPSVQDFKHGESYLASIIMIIPKVFLGGYSFASKAALDTWLQNILNMSYGPGFNIFAETYYNFGWYGGIAFSIILGLFFGKMLNLKSKDIQKNELLKILSFIFLFNSLTIARFPFHSTIRNIVYLYVIPYLLIMLIYNKNKKIGERYEE